MQGSFSDVAKAYLSPRVLPNNDYKMQSEIIAGFQLAVCRREAAQGPRVKGILEPL